MKKLLPILTIIILAGLSLASCKNYRLVAGNPRRIDSITVTYFNKDTTMFKEYPGKKFLVWDSLRVGQKIRIGSMSVIYFKPVLQIEEPKSAFDYFKHN